MFCPQLLFTSHRILFNLRLSADSVSDIYSLLFLPFFLCLCLFVLGYSSVSDSDENKRTQMNN